MNSPTDNEPFYIGYLPKAPAATTTFVRKAIALIGATGLITAAVAAFTLRYAGAGQFEFGRPRELRGTLRCEVAPRLQTNETDYLLVGYGKNRVAPEICGASGKEVAVRGTLIQRDGRQLLEMVAEPVVKATAAAESPAVTLGRVTMRGEIVDSKCYFGVMNPAEGRTHRACAELCLRGGVPAVFVARDQSGATAHLIIAGAAGAPIIQELLPWVGEPVEATGDVFRQGKWLVWRLEPSSLRRI